MSRFNRVLFGAVTILALSAGNGFAQQDQSRLRGGSANINSGGNPWT